MIRIITLLILLLSYSLFAQNFQGEVTYQTHRKIELKLNDDKANAEMQKQLQEMLKKQFQKEFVLQFNAEESIYKEEKSLGKPSPAMGGMEIIVAGGGDADVLYKNIKEQRFSNKTEMLGKSFLVKDSLTDYKWQLENETKQIGNYTCYKAIAKRVKRILMNKTENGKEPESIEEEKEVVITAWYTPEIPVSNGPSYYSGLPGLILEINDGDQSILCTKIVLNPKDDLKIEEPTKGKKVSKEEFDTILEKKMKEMTERTSGRKGDGNTIEIKIGG